MSRLVLIVLCLALVVVACRGDDGDPETGATIDATPTSEIDEHLAERLDDLEREVGELRDELRAIADVDLDDELERIDERLLGLAERVDTVDAGLNDEATARESTLAELRALTGDLQDAVSALQSARQQLRRDLDGLRDDHELLKARFDNHQSHPPG